MRRQGRESFRGESATAARRDVSRQDVERFMSLMARVRSEHGTRLMSRQTDAAPLYGMYIDKTNLNVAENAVFERTVGKQNCFCMRLVLILSMYTQPLQIFGVDMSGGILGRLIHRRNTS
jgi:hypothetical protein